MITIDKKKQNVGDKVIFFFDIDGTLIRTNQKPNSLRLPFVIKKLKPERVMFALNSNRSLNDVLSIKKWLHLNGPIILENGTYFLVHDEEYLLSKKAVPISSIIRTLTTYFVLVNALPCEVIIGDTVQYFKDERFSATPLVILINQYRKYTGSIHILRYGKHDFKLAHKLTDFLKKEFKCLKLKLSVECSPTFGNVTIWPSDANKTASFKKIKRIYKGSRMYMIGDSMSDAATAACIDGFFAVGNARPDVKKHALYVSPYSYTKGVVDILLNYKKYINK